MHMQRMFSCSSKSETDYKCITSKQSHKLESTKLHHEHTKNKTQIQLLHQALELTLNLLKMYSKPWNHQEGGLNWLFKNSFLNQSLLDRI